MDLELIISQIKLTIKQNISVNENLKNIVQILIKQCNCKYAVLWLQENKDNVCLYPYYWICPLDFSNVTLSNNDEYAVIAYNTKQIYGSLDNKSNDSFIEKYLNGLDITSTICLPLVNKECFGVIQLFYTNGVDYNNDVINALKEVKECIESTCLDYKKINNPINSDILLSVKDITKVYSNGNIETPVLKGVNLDIHNGEFLSLLGPSGSGKSTLLNIIGGLDKLTSGEVLYLGNNLDSYNSTQLVKYRRDNIGFIFQNYNLMPNLTAKQNLDLIGELVNEPLDSLKALELVGLKDKADNYPSQLSGGQQQRVSIARALIKKPRIIMADEPTAALDYNSSINVLEVLDKISKEGTAIVMVTHNEEITKMTNRIVRLRDGKIYEVSMNTNPTLVKDLVW